jgi:hypothetical protein
MFKVREAAGDGHTEYSIRIVPPPMTLTHLGSVLSISKRRRRGAVDIFNQNTILSNTLSACKIVHPGFL